MFQPYKQRNRWKLPSALPSFSHSYSQPSVKPLHRAVPLEANSLSGNLKQNFSVSLQPAFGQTFWIHIQFENDGKAHNVSWMNNAYIISSAREPMCICDYQAFMWGVLSMWRQHIYIHDWVTELQALQKHFFSTWEFLGCNVLLSRRVTFCMQS